MKKASKEVQLINPRKFSKEKKRVLKESQKIYKGSQKNLNLAIKRISKQAAK